MKRAMILAVSVFALAACDQKSETKADDPSAKNATSTTSATPVTTAAAPPTIADTDLSTPADFEEAAEKSITKANYKNELSTLDSDIAKE